jgi:hypothetical protein
LCKIVNVDQDLTGEVLIPRDTKTTLHHTKETLAILKIENMHPKTEKTTEAMTETKTIASMIDLKTTSIDMKGTIMIGTRIMIGQTIITEARITIDNLIIIGLKNHLIIDKRITTGPKITVDMTETKTMVKSATLDTIGIVTTATIGQGSATTGLTILASALLRLPNP